jgi:hypothetical protein
MLLVLLYRISDYAPFLVLLVLLHRISDYAPFFVLLVLLYRISDYAPFSSQTRVVKMLIYCHGHNFVQAV